MYRRHFGRPPKQKPDEPKPTEARVELRVVEQRKPEPEPEPQEDEGERRKAKPGEGSAHFASEQAKDDDGEVLLSKGAPYDIAKEFVRRNWIKDGVLVLYWWSGKWWGWNGVCYGEVAEAKINSEVWEFLDEGRTGTDKVRFRPKPADAEGVIKALKAGCGHTLDPPCWLDSGKSAEGVLVFQNGIVDIETGKLEELSPKLWTMNALDFEYQAEAKCEVWDRFPSEVFEGDGESRVVIEEQLGLGMTEDARFQKGFLWIGMKGREGKGTLAWVQEKLCVSYVSLSFHDWLKTPYSAEAMLYWRVP
jgi:hypothetical protein